jgi:hypothetical protein
MSKARNAGGNDIPPRYTYLQVQAKMDYPYLVLDDMLPYVTQFCFVCCFSIVWPLMPFCALVSNAILGRFSLWRRLRLARRNFPLQSEGVGVWVSVMKTSVFIACSVNTAIAVFVMNPLKSLDNQHKLLIFIIMEHCMLGLVGLMFIMVPSTPMGPVLCDESNQRWKDVVVDSFPHARKSSRSSSFMSRLGDQMHRQTKARLSMDLMKVVSSSADVEPYVEDNDE